MEMEKFRLEAPDGHSIQVYRWAAEEPRGIVQVLHGMSEHALRYAPFAELLVAAGWTVVAHDHRGHGHSVAGPEDLGHFGDEAGFDKVLSDVRQVRKWARKGFRGPVFLLGHSMGSFIALADQTEQPGTVDVLILSGSSQGKGALLRSGIWAARAERARMGRRGKSALLNFLSFGSFNRAFTPARTARDWLSRDESQVDLYIADPLCGVESSTQLWVDLLTVLIDIGRTRRLARLPRDLPVLLFAGDQDPVSDGGKGVVALADQLRRAGLEDVSHKLYAGGRHEMFHEINAPEVMQDVLTWLEATPPAA